MTRYCPSQDWDKYDHQMETRAMNELLYSSVKKDGLYSKFYVYRTDALVAAGDGGDEGISVEAIPMELPSFVLVPFASDGSTRDPHAVAALKAYARSVGGELAAAITEWLEATGRGSKLLNQPPEWHEELVWSTP